SSPVVASWTVDNIPPLTTASQKAGSYTPTQPVTLSTSEPATIHYTTDGSEPTDASPVYAGPIAISPGGAVKFFAIDGVGNRETVKAYGPAVASVSLQIAATEGSTVTFAAQAAGGIGPYEYMFFLVPPEGVWQIVQRYGTEHSWTWDQSGMPPGQYSVMV